MSVVAAMAAAERGWFVFPTDHPDLPQCAGVGIRSHSARNCKRGKCPTVHWPTWATTDIDTIAAEWSGCNRNVGIHCGKSGLLVVDEDVLGALDQYAANVGQCVPMTYTVRTGRSGGGRHIYFAVPEGASFGNSEGPLHELGCNVRAGNGYVIAAGSVHASGAIYELECDADLAPLPGWLAEALTSPRSGEACTAKAEPVDFVTLPDWLRADLALLNPADRSAHFHRIIAGCRRAGLSEGQALTVVLDWLGRAGCDKYAGREAEEVARSWAKITTSGEEARSSRVTTAKQRREIEAALYHYGRHFDDGHVEDEQQIFDRDGNPVFGAGPRFDPNVGGEDEDEREIPEPGEGTIVVTAAPENPMAVARQLVAELMTHSDGTLITPWWRGDYYGWIRTHWQEQSTAKLRSVLYRVMSYAYYQDEFLLVPWQPTRRKIGDLLEALQALVHLEERTEAPQWICGQDRGPVIAVANGGLHLDGRVLTEHTPRYFNLTSLPYDYDKEAPEPKRWLQFLGDLFPDDQDSIDLLQEWCGYVVAGGTDQHKIMLLVGPPRAGKGTIARTLAAIIGKDAVASPTLSSMSQNFGLQPLIGKALAIVGDVRLGPDTFVVTERLLSISGEDYITVDRKYRDPWTGRLGVRFMLVSNELPHLGDASGALASRFTVLQLTRSWLGREDHDLQDKLEAELGGILNWCLVGLDRLNRQQRFTMP